jgi:5-(carboxyamino)imidazole ribonucleotide mutase
MASKKEKPLVGIIMGSQSDWDTMKHCAEQLESLGVPHVVKVISAHRTPDLLDSFIGGARKLGLEILPVLGVPMKAWSLDGLDSLLSIVQMPRGIPVGTLAIGKAGAVNAALLATSILGNKYPVYRNAYERFRRNQTKAGEANQDIA